VAEITDEFMREMLTKSRPYSLMILKAGPNYGTDGSDRIVWEHGRRNFSLRADGLLSIVCPVPDDTEVCGVGIFNAETDEVGELMDNDPGVQAGIFTYEVHPCRSFPEDALA
jgi:hypothetical protein